MVKSSLVILRNILVFTNRTFKTYGSLRGKYFYQRAGVKILPKHYETFDYDWEHKIGLSLKREIPLDGVTEIEEFHKLPDIVKETYTYKHLPRERVIEQEIANICSKLGFDDLLHPLAYGIIKNTLWIRYKKERVKQDYRRKGTVISVGYLVRQRNSDLATLKSINGAQFESICKEFGIAYKANDPEPEEAPDAKLMQFITETTKLREKKDKILREELKVSEDAFYAKKKQTLEDIKEKLGNLKLTVEEVYREVVAERTERAMKPIVDEQYRWFEKEKELKVYHVKIAAEKKAARDRKVRR